MSELRAILVCWGSVLTGHWAIPRAERYIRCCGSAGRADANPSLFMCSARHCIGLDRTVEASFCVFDSVEIQHILL